MMPGAEKRTPQPLARRGARGDTTGYAGDDTASPIDRLLSRLDAVRRTGAGRWLARCPAHDDRSPSLSIKETDDGTVLLKCWAGCGAADIVGAVGLTLCNLFPPRLDHHRSPTRLRDRWNPRDLLSLLRREATVVMVAANDLRAGIALSDDDHQRLVEACGRISAVVSEVAP